MGLSTMTNTLSPSDNDDYVIFDNRPVGNDTLCYNVLPYGANFVNNWNLS